MTLLSSNPRHGPLSRLLGALAGLAAGWLLTRLLPVVPACLLSALALVAAATLSSQPLRPSRWWAVLGGASGALLGTAVVLGRSLQSSDPADGLPQRALVLASLALAGLVAGRHLSLSGEQSDRRHPRDILRSVSALTTGIFAVLVTLTFLHSGLDQARTFSSRLSTSLTILVAAVSVPGWIAHLLRRASPPSS